MTDRERTRMDRIAWTACRMLCRVAGLALLILPVSCSLLPEDWTLYVGVWQNEHGSVDFKYRKFVLDRTFSFGTLEVQGRYGVNPVANPKQMDLSPTRVKVVFRTEDETKQWTFRRSLSAGIPDELYNMGLALCRDSEDVRSMRLMRILLLAMSDGRPLEGIYSIVINSGTYLRMDFALPPQDRPWDFGAGWVSLEF